jgi:glycine cleavage system aminomethyltransferase T
MATDQGKTANVLGLAVMADASGKSIPETGTTIFRPPYTPVPIGALAGRARGKDFRPFRLTPSHAWAKEQGAEFVETGMWLRAQWFPRAGETTWRQSVDREVQMTRNSVGICDVTTLGKIDIQGRDAAAFLNKIYANAFAKLAVGKVRYGLMLREDGICYDDGTTARLSENHFVMTTTTANAVTVFRNMEFARQCLWPDMDVHLISATDGWAQFAVAGPNSRALLQKIVDDTDLSNEAFPFMACAELTVCGGTPARLFRISFSGEMAFEIAVPARYGDSMIRALMAAGEEFDAVPYGTEALGVMRIEKGHAAGNELNGQTTAQMLGLGMMVSKKKDSIGSKLSEREMMNQPDDMRLVGFKPVDQSNELNAGAHFITKGDTPTMQSDQGWMTSVAYSPTLGHSIGLGFIKRGSDRMGEVVRAYDPTRGKDTDVEICSPHFYDPDGGRQRG